MRSAARAPRQSCSAFSRFRAANSSSPGFGAPCGRQCWIWESLGKERAKEGKDGGLQSPRTSLKARPKTRITGALPMDHTEGSPAEERPAHAPSPG
ncbi:LOW QUALITY PROTEIN: uncharacterized protein LOC100594552 [Nomascus leucogenys]|uniref:LOW QUALITY PROTEIN: uncharacterized protein LOC100594552 n=1 Tax=Nomascus leucogenys TaxID=61853 RepID=UPI00122DB95F|nr:LOW QUALITY PROTEIN: uncharacterized protein LOC100594552 [Nomascus leucogenys]